MPVTTSTDYYRKNRETGSVVYRCPHEGCNYSTRNCKQVLIHHINSKHTKECDRPFQCQHCERGFAQKANLIKHMKCEHGIDTSSLSNKTTTILYIIKTVKNNEPRSKNTRARRDYYKNNPTLKSRDIFNKKHEYLDGVFLKNHDLHYDIRNNFITVDKVELKGSIQKCPTRKKKHVLLKNVCNKKGRYGY